MLTIDFLKKIRSKGNNPLIVVLTGGSPLIIPEVMELADAVLFAFYPGEQGGNAVADIIFGDTSPSGRMPFTIPQTIDDLPDYNNYDMEGRTYRYMTKEPLVPFGFGLTYSKATFALPSLETTDNTVVVKAKISNSGNTPVEEVTQLYLSSPLAGQGHPLYSLKAFQRISLQANESKTITFILKKTDFELINELGEGFVAKGDYKVFVGNAVPSQRSQTLGAAKPLELTISAKLLKKLN